MALRVWYAIPQHSPPYQTVFHEARIQPATVASGSHVQSSGSSEPEIFRYRTEAGLSYVTIKQWPYA